MEAMWVIVATLALTRSFSVLIVAACFLPVLLLRGKNILLAVSGLAAGAMAAIFFMGDRLRDGIHTSGGSITDLMTDSVNSWRNIPDLLILTNVGDCLWPGDPSEVRLKINTLAVNMSPALVWIKNTFSTFSAAGVTVGLLATVGVFAGGIAIAFKSHSFSRPMRNTWLMLYLAAWFFMAKWDPSAWIALGLLLSVRKLCKQAQDECPSLASQKLHCMTVET
jgi:hypothetical protein